MREKETAELPRERERERKTEINRKNEREDISHLDALIMTQRASRRERATTPWLRTRKPTNIRDSEVESPNPNDKAKIHSPFGVHWICRFSIFHLFGWMTSKKMLKTAARKPISSWNILERISMRERMTVAIILE